jgi:DNA-binding response OmpR family regulator/anti-sigma regulatory factor (Ser/Thr protein kinase)
MTNLLLIDDNHHFQLGLSTNLRRAGFDVAVASNGDDGIRLAREIHPELIICDMKMPGLDGMAVKRALNGDSETENIPFIFLSALSGPTIKCKGLLSGADDYIGKPFNFEELIARIRSVLRREERTGMKSRQDIQQLLENLESSLPIHTSHLFRTQLGIILLSLDMLSRKTANPEIYLDYAMGSAIRSRILVDSLIWLNEFDLGRYETQGTQLDLEGNFIIPIKELMQVWKEKNLQFDIQVDQFALRAPAHSFTLAACHLVDNACKFSPAGGRVQIHMRGDPGGDVIFTVQDQGPGIPPQMQEMVFDRFYQIPNELELPENHGLGLGLFIARSFAQLRGGDVKILDIRDGCRVQMTLKQKYNP